MSGFSKHNQARAWRARARIRLCGGYSRRGRLCTPVLQFNHVIARAVSRWLRAQTDQAGAGIAYTCKFKCIRSSGGEKKLVFKAGVCIAGISAEQEIHVKPDNLRCGLPFPEHALHNLRLVFDSLRYSSLHINKETSTAVTMWRRAHPNRKGVDAEYACSFKASQSIGWKKTFLFKATVCIDGVSAEEVLNVQSENLWCGLPFPLHAYNSVCARLAAIEYINTSMSAALSAWRRAHPGWDGVDADYTCNFKTSQTSRARKVLLFEAGVRIGGIFVEQEIQVRADAIRRGLRFPTHAYCRVCLQLAAIKYARLRKTKCELVSVVGNVRHTRGSSWRAVLRLPDVFDAGTQISSKELVLGTEAVWNVVFHNQLMCWNPLSAARTESLVFTTGFFDHFASTTWRGLKYAGLISQGDGLIRPTLVHSAPIGRTTLEFDACWQFSQGHTVTLSPHRLASLPPNQLGLLAEDPCHHLAMPVPRAEWLGGLQCLGTFTIKQTIMLHLHVSLWYHTLDKGLFSSMPADHLMPVWWASPAKRPALPKSVLFIRGCVPEIVYEHAHAQRAEDAAGPSASDADRTDSDTSSKLTLPSTRKRHRFVRPHCVFQEVHRGPMDVY